MNELKNILFFVWILCIPFSAIFASVFGKLPPDKILAPVLLVLGILTLVRASQHRGMSVLIFSTLAIIYLIVSHISFVAENELYWDQMYKNSIGIGYFIIPLLCITNLRQFRMAGWAVCIVAMLGAITALLASLGLLELPVERFSQSRVGLDFLPKAVGIISVYGDYSQYLAFATLWILSLARVSDRKGVYAVFKVLMVITILSALLGMQSRNVLFSLILAYAMLLFLRYYEKKGAGLRMILIYLSWFSFSFLIVFLAAFFDLVIETLAGIGGEGAQGTAMARMLQYEDALRVIKEFPLFGVDAVLYRQHIEYLNGIHNTWLRMTAIGGVASLIVIIVLFFRYYFQVRRAAFVPEKAPYAMVVTAYFFVVLFSSNFYGAFTALFWCLFGIGLSIACIDPADAPRQEKKRQVEDDLLA